MFLRVHQQDDGNHSIIFGKDMTSINDLMKSQLNEEYEMNDLGKLIFFLLGIQVHRDKDKGKSHLSQPGYIRTILER
jgi:hypothetical protein